MGDDAGSGGDAPDAPRPDVWVQPGVIYSGTMIAWFDRGDWYAFAAPAGGTLRMALDRMVGCPELERADGSVVDADCASDPLLQPSLQAELEPAALYYLGVTALTSTSYRFTFMIDDEPLPIAPMAPQLPVEVPGDDAGSGADAPDVRSDQLRVAPWRVYEGNATTGLDSEDWYAFEVDGPERAVLRSSTHGTCPRITDGSGRDLAACSGDLEEVVAEANLLDAGVYYIGFTSWQFGAYRFSLGLGAPGPVTVALLPEWQSDAGSGRDAPSGPYPDVWVGRDTTYDGLMAAVVDYGDYYAFEAPPGAALVVVFTGTWGPGGCPTVRTAADVAVPSACAPARLPTDEGALTVGPTEGGLHYLAWASKGGESYRFTIMVDPSPLA